MKHDCDIIRDLMPLCIDGTASEKSRHMVGEHVLECQPCMEIYQEMRAEVPKGPVVSKDAAPFGDTVKKLRKKRNKRRVLGIIAGVMVGILLVMFGTGVYVQLTTEYSRVAPDEDYSFTLARRTNGQIVVTHHNISGKRQDARWEFDEQTGILQLYAVTPIWALPAERDDANYMYNELYWDENTGRLMIRSLAYSGEWESYEVKEVHRGATYKGDGFLREIIYVQGNDIPMVDPAIDAAYDVVQVRGRYGEYGSYSECLALNAPVTVAPTLTPMRTMSPEEKEAYDAELAYIEAMNALEPTPTPMLSTEPTASAQVEID